MSEAPRAFVRKNVIPVERDAISRELESKFDISKNEAGEQELFIQDGENRLRLNDYLPEGVVFNGRNARGTFAVNFEYDLVDIGPPYRRMEQQQVGFPIDKIDSVAGRLSLLHEMGHAIDFSTAENTREQRFSFLTRDMIANSLHRVDESEEYLAIKDPEQKKTFFVQAFRKEWQREAKRMAGDGLPRLMYRDLIKALEQVVHQERAAWANALKTYRSVKAERQVDLLEGANSEEIFRKVNQQALSSYEAAYGSILDDYRSKGPLRRVIEGFFT